MIDSTLYSVEIYKQGITLDGYYKIVSLMRYICKKNNTSFLCVFSSSDSRFAIPFFEQSGKRGRPKRKVYGRKVAPHLHSAVLGTAEKSAFSVCQEICKRLKEKHGIAGKVVSKGREQHAVNYIEYCFRQADVVRSGGDFDFVTMERKDKP